MRIEPRKPRERLACVAMADLSGRVLGGRFELTRLLDEAEEASLYEAVQLDVGRRVAIKVLPEGGDATDAARLRQEAYAMATIDDPHVAKILEIGGGDASGDPTFLVMERRTGETLEGKGPMSAERGVHIAFQIAHALEAAHAVGIIHRDVRPANVMLVRTASDDAFVELGGFGLAKVQGDADDVKTKTTIVAQRSRDRFTPPEGNARSKASAAMDVFGAGACLQALLAEPIDRELARIVAKATAKDPKARYASARELKEALKAWKPAQSDARPRSLVPYVIAALVSTSLALAVVVLIVRDRAKPATAPPPPLPGASVVAPPAASSSVVVVETEPSSGAPPETASAIAKPAASAKLPPAKPARGAFDVVGPLERVPAAEGEAWRVAMARKVNACVQRHGLGECKVKSFRLHYYLHPDGRLEGHDPSAYDAESRECPVPAPLAECVKAATTSVVSKPAFKATTQWVESWHRVERVE